MIKVMNPGRLANHLFQYAFACAAAFHLKTKFEFNDELLSKYFNLKVSKPSWFDKLFFKIKSDKEILSFNNLQSASEVFSMLKDNSQIAGYFQSEDYFKNCTEIIRHEFQIKENVLREFKLKYSAELSTDYCCVAIRLGDYKEWILGDGLDVSPLLPISFFKESLAKINPERIIFISDQIEEVKKEFSALFPKAIFNERCSDPIEDFLLLKFAKSAIISNSSFYWWACWLNENPNCKIYVPEYWLGFRKRIEYPNGVIPERWVKMPVIVNE